MDDADLPSRSLIISMIADLVVVATGYTVYIILMIPCIKYFLYRPYHYNGSRKSRIATLMFLFVSFVVVTIWYVVACSDVTNTFLCTVHSGNSFEFCYDSVDRGAWLRYNFWWTSLQTIFSLADLMLFFRMGVIWRWKPWLIVLAVLFFLGQTGLQIFLFLPNTVYAHALGTAGYIFSASYDLTLSGLIIGKLLHLHRNSKLAGRQESVYKSLLVVFLEASLLASSTRILTMVFDACGSELTSLWPEDLSAIGSAIAPLLLILRLASQAGDKSRHHPSSTLAFAPPTNATGNIKKANQVAVQVPGNFGDSVNASETRVAKYDTGFEQYIELDSVTNPRKSDFV